MPPDAKKLLGEVPPKPRTARARFAAAVSVARIPVESPRYVRRVNYLEGSLSWHDPTPTRASFVSALSEWLPRCGLTIRVSMPR